MIMRLLTFLLIIIPTFLRADVIDNIIEQHILVGYSTLASKAQTLSEVSMLDCEPESETLRSAYHSAFDAWIGVSHLRFGPSEVDDRAFALAFWPDTKGFTPRTLNKLINEQDQIAQSAEAYAEVSIAARGFYALEFLLYDEQFQETPDDAYRCQLIQTITKDIAHNAKMIAEEWEQTHADVLRNPSDETRYRSRNEVVQELFKSLMTGLQFTSDTRIGRPMGSFDKPRPKRAEARRSGRSLRNVTLSLIALNDLAKLLSQDVPQLQNKLDAAFERALDKATDLDDPVFAGVQTSQGRIRVEVLQNAIDRIREISNEELGPALGVAAGFNALDGD